MLDAGLVHAAIGGLLGLLVGSFLNVVIHRLPLMLERGWRLDSAEMLGVKIFEFDGDARPIDTTEWFNR